MTVLTMSDDAKRRVRRTNMAIAWLWVPFAVVLSVPLSFGTHQPLIVLGFLALSLLLVGLTAVLVGRMNDRTRIEMDGGTYAVHGMGRTRRFTVAEAARVVTIDRMALGVGGTAATLHLVVAGRTKPLVHLVGQMWDRDQLGALALDLAHHGVPLTPIHEPVTPVQLRAYDPRLMPAWRAHPVALGLLSGLGAVVVMLLVLTIVLIALYA